MGADGESAVGATATGVATGVAELPQAAKATIRKARKTADSPNLFRLLSFIVHP